ncbi:MAG: hypothetical protein J3K34DRAFT_107302 [Monoraphidium minutum]|nr:MAG: hypothetical protein J3K34DRAFT_107302 [Monoraphidium minutum]
MAGCDGHRAPTGASECQRGVRAGCARRPRQGRAPRRARWGPDSRPSGHYLKTMHSNARGRHACRAGKTWPSGGGGRARGAAGPARARTVAHRPWEAPTRLRPRDRGPDCAGHARQGCRGRRGAGEGAGAGAAGRYCTASSGLSALGQPRLRTHSATSRSRSSATAPGSSAPRCSAAAAASRRRELVLAGALQPVDLPKVGGDPQLRRAPRAQPEPRRGAGRRRRRRRLLLLLLVPLLAAGLDPLLQAADRPPAGLVGKPRHRERADRPAAAVQAQGRVQKLRRAPQPPVRRRRHAVLVGAKRKHDGPRAAAPRPRGAAAAALGAGGLDLTRGRGVRRAAAGRAAEARRAAALAVGDAVAAHQLDARQLRVERQQVPRQPQQRARRSVLRRLVLALPAAAAQRRVARRGPLVAGRRHELVQARVLQQHARREHVGVHVVRAALEQRRRARRARRRRLLVLLLLLLLLLRLLLLLLRLLRLRRGGRRRRQLQVHGQRDRLRERERHVERPPRLDVGEHALPAAADEARGEQLRGGPRRGGQQRADEALGDEAAQQQLRRHRERAPQRRLEQRGGARRAGHARQRRRRGQLSLGLRDRDRLGRGGGGAAAVLRLFEPPPQRRQPLLLLLPPPRLAQQVHHAVKRGGLQQRL